MANNPLTDALPPKARRYVYAAVFVASIVYGAYQVSDGDWKQTVGAVLVGLVSALAGSNVSLRDTQWGG